MYMVHRSILITYLPLFSSDHLTFFHAVYFITTWSMTIAGGQPRINTPLSRVKSLNIPVMGVGVMGLSQGLLCLLSLTLID